MSFVSRVLARLGNGLDQAIRGTGSGELAVEIGGANTSAFGDLITAENTAVLQYDFVYQSTPNGQLFVNTVSGAGATADVSNGRLRLQCGTANAGYALHQSFVLARYRAGQGNTARFTWAFPAGIATNEQLTGMGDAAIGAQPTSGYFFGYNNTTFGILHRNAWAADTWYAKTSWNVDVCDGSNSVNNPSGFNLNPQNGNVYMIRYPYLGYGDILFFVQNSATGRWILVHVIQYTNTTTVLQLGNPGLRFCATIRSTGSTTNLTGYCGSVGVLLSGTRIYTGPVFACSARQTTNTANTEKPVLSLRNCTSMNGVANRGVIRLRSLSVAGDGANTDMLINLRMNASTLATPAPTFTPRYGTTADNGVTLTAAQSIASFDTTSTTFTADGAGTTTIRFNTTLARNTGYQIDMTPYDIFLMPGDILTVTGTSGANNNVTLIGLNWNEDV